MQPNKKGFIIPKFAIENRKESNTKPENTSKINELNDLFNAIVGEIEERQKHLIDITKLSKNHAIEERIKSEIASRIAELQKIAELKSNLV